MSDFSNTFDPKERYSHWSNFSKLPPYEEFISKMKDNTYAQSIYSDIAKRKGELFTKNIGFNEWYGQFGLNTPQPSTAGQVQSSITQPPHDNTGIADVNEPQLTQGGTEPPVLVPPTWNPPQPQEQQTPVENVWKPVVDQMVDQYTQDHNADVIRKTQNLIQYADILHPDELSGSIPVPIKQFPPNTIPQGIKTKGEISIAIPDTDLYKRARLSAYDAAEMGNYDVSTNLTKQILLENPNDDWALQLDAWNKKQKGDFEGAFESINTAIDIASKNKGVRPDLYLNRATIAMQNGNEITAGMDAKRYLNSFQPTQTEESYTSEAEANRILYLTTQEDKYKEAYYSNLSKAKASEKERQRQEDARTLIGMADYLATSPFNAASLIIKPVMGASEAIDKIASSITGKEDVYKQVDPNITQKEVEQLTPSERAVMGLAGTWQLAMSLGAFVPHGEGIANLTGMKGIKAFATGFATPALAEFNLTMQAANTAIPEKYTNIVLAPISTIAGEENVSNMSRIGKEGIAIADMTAFMGLMHLWGGAKNVTKKIGDTQQVKELTSKIAAIYDKITNKEGLTPEETQIMKESISEVTPQEADVIVTQAVPEIKKEISEPKSQTETPEIPIETKEAEGQKPAPIDDVLGELEEQKAEEPTTPQQHAENIKTKFRDTFKEKGVKDEEIDGAIALMDARAKSWASEEEGRQPEQWYDRIADIKGGEFQEGTPKQFQLPDGRKVTGISVPEVTNGFYSPIEKRVLDTKVEKQSVNKWKAIIGGGDEAKFTGVSDWLNSLKPDQQLTKSEIQEWMKDNRIEVVEVMKEEQGLPLFQKNKGQQPKGAVETLADGRKVIHALESPDFSTMVHEIAHVFEADLTPKEKELFSDSEKFARGFERYLRDGKAPTEELRTLFEKFKQWLTDIYQQLKGSPIETKITPEVKDVFDRLLTEKKETKQEKSEILTDLDTHMKLKGNEFKEYEKQMVEKHGENYLKLKAITKNFNEIVRTLEEKIPETFKKICP